MVPLDLGIPVGAKGCCSVGFKRVGAKKAVDPS